MKEILVSAGAGMDNFQGSCNAEMPRFRQAEVRVEGLRTKRPGDPFWIPLAKRLRSGPPASHPPVPVFSSSVSLNSLPNLSVP